MSQPSDKAADPIQVEEGQSSAQNTRRWYLEDSEAYSRKSNTSIEPLICGAEAFGAVQEAMMNAKKSVCIITWGFDPSLRLEGCRVSISKNLDKKNNVAESKTTCFPYKGGELSDRPRIGDVLLNLASRGIQVRVLVWNDVLARLMRVDENLPESGPYGRGPETLLHRSIWRAKCAGETLKDKYFSMPISKYIKDEKTKKIANEMTDREFSSKMTALADSRLKNYCLMLQQYKKHYERPFKKLNSARASAKAELSLWYPIDKVNAGFEDPSLDTLKEVNAGFQAKYWRGYPCSPMGLGFVDSPLTQVDDHYYNAEWFLLVKGQVDDAPAWVKNLKVQYRGQNRAVDGGESPALKRLNQVAARLERLIPMIQSSPAYCAVNEYMQDFFLWWHESELTRTGEDGVWTWGQNAAGNVVNFLKTNNITNLYGVRDELSKKVDEIAKIPLDKLASMIKSAAELEELTNAVGTLAAHGVRTIAATYHQKTVVVDYESDSDAVGFVMGHNMLKNYMDDIKHLMFDSGVRYPEFGPWQDISSKVRGSALEDLVKNFHESWDDAPGGSLKPGNKIDTKTGAPINGLAQVVRTALNPGGVAPDENVPSMEHIYNWTADQLEVICNYMEEALGLATTKFHETKAYTEARIAALKEELAGDIDATKRVLSQAELHLLEAKQQAQQVPGKARDLYAASPEPVREAGSAAYEFTRPGIERVSATADIVTSGAGKIYGAGQEAAQNAYNDTTQKVRDAQEAVRPGVEQMRQKAGDLRDQAEGMYQSGRRDAQNAYEDARQKGEDLYDQTKENAEVRAKEAVAKVDAELGMDHDVKPAVRGADKMSIYNSYLGAINECSNFLYTENQYFRHEKIAEAVKARAAQHTGDEGNTPSGLPIHWFVVTNHPVTPGEAPNTQKMLAILGQEERLGQLVRNDAKAEYYKYKDLTDDLKKLKELEKMEAEGDFGKFSDNFNRFSSNAEIRQKRIDELAKLRARRSDMEKEVGELEEKHLSIKSYGDSAKGAFDVEEPSDAFKTAELNGLKVLVGTLATSYQSSADSPCMYTNIYVHSKLLVVDDAFMSLGSANINRRSMHVDAELNINTDSNGTAMNLRKQLFKMHTVLEDDPSISQTFKNWQAVMDDNWRFMHKGEPLEGFLVHFCDPDTPPATPTD